MNESSESEAGARSPTPTPGSTPGSTPAEAGVEAQPKWMRISLIVVGLAVLALVVVLSRG